MRPPGRALMATAAAAALSAAALALVGVALLPGWIGRGGAAPDHPARVPRGEPAPFAAGAAPKSEVPPELALLPGETLVEPPAPPRPEPLMPPYSAPRAPPPAPRGAPPRLIERPIPGEEEAADAPPPWDGERPPPRYGRREHPTSPFDRWPQPEVCDTCGIVIGVRERRAFAEIRIRFEDGEVAVFRTRAPSPWRRGDRVRYEHGRLVSDQGW